MARPRRQQFGVLILVGCSALPPAAAIAADRPLMPAGDKVAPRPPAKPVPAAAKDPPATAPDDAPGGRRQLANGLLAFAPPPADTWVESATSRTANRNVYVSADRSASMSVEALPADQVIKADMAAGIVRTLKQLRARSTDKPTQEPAVEKDDRFAVRVHERFASKDGKPGEQLHLYRAVGPRFLLVTCKTFGGADAAKDHLAAAEAVSLSATFTKPAKK